MQGDIVGGNQLELERIFCNLINNSIESFLDNSGNITIRVAGYSEQVVIVIQDNGVGIQQDILTKLGGSEITSGKENGNGLGIYHAKKSIDEVGGTFEIQSRVGLGTMITIKLPALKNN